MTPADQRVTELIDKWLKSLELHLAYTNLTDEAYWKVQPWVRHQRPARLDPRPRPRPRQGSEAPARRASRERRLEFLRDARAHGLPRQPRRRAEHRAVHPARGARSREPRKCSRTRTRRCSAQFNLDPDAHADRADARDAPAGRGGDARDSCRGGGRSRCGAPADARADPAATPTPAPSPAAVAPRSPTVTVPTLTVPVIVIHPPSVATASVPSAQPAPALAARAASLARWAARPLPSAPAPIEPAAAGGATPARPPAASPRVATSLVRPAAPAAHATMPPRAVAIERIEAESLIRRRRARARRTQRA